MRRAFRASRLVATVVAQFLYLAFEEALRARAARRREVETVPMVPSVHEMPTLPGTVPAPLRDLVPLTPIIRVMDSKSDSDSDSESVSESESVSVPVSESESVSVPVSVPEEAPAALSWIPAVLGDFDDLVESASTEEPLDVTTLLDTLRRDVGCGRFADPRTHEACRAAEALGTLVDRDAVLAALEETVMAAGRPDCVRIAATGALGRASRSAARRALSRMLGVARSRAGWSGARSDRDLVSLLLHTLDA